MPVRPFVGLKLARAPVLRGGDRCINVEAILLIWRNLWLNWVEAVWTSQAVVAPGWVFSLRGNNRGFWNVI